MDDLTCYRKMKMMIRILNLTLCETHATDSLSVSVWAQGAKWDEDRRPHLHHTRVDEAEAEAEAEKKKNRESVC